jgi:hypothetical protein
MSKNPIIGRDRYMNPMSELARIPAAKTPNSGWSSRIEYNPDDTRRIAMSG